MELRLLQWKIKLCQAKPAHSMHAYLPTPIKFTASQLFLDGYSSESYYCILMYLLLFDIVEKHMNCSLLTS